MKTKTAEFLKVEQKLTKTNQELESLFLSQDSQLQGVFENIVEPYIIIDLFGNTLKMNEAAVSLLDFKHAKEDFNLNKMVDPAEIERVHTSFKTLFHEGVLKNFNLNVITRKKRHILIQINANIIYDQGNPVAAQAIVRDITKEKANEDQLVESKKRLSTLVNNLDIGVLLQDENHGIISSNKKFTEFFGLNLSFEELQGLNYIEVFKQKSKLLIKPEAFLNNIQIISKKKKQFLVKLLSLKTVKL